VPLIVRDSPFGEEQALHPAARLMKNATVSPKFFFRFENKFAMVAFTRGHENYLHRFYLGCYLTVLDSYNVFNHTQWGTIYQNMSAPTAGTPFSGANAGASGQITTARDPRLLQLGGKFYF